MDLEALKKFIVEAKINTYAGDGDLAPVPSRPNSKDLYYEQGELLYIDSYFGGADFIGQEIVFKSKKPIWGMNYYGKMIVDGIPEGFSKCLKSALKAVPVEHPFRGPAVFEHGRFVYRCSWQGDFSHFEGDEEIYLDGNMIYKLSFHGGMIK